MEENTEQEAAQEEAEVGVTLEEAEVPQEPMTGRQTEFLHQDGCQHQPAPLTFKVHPVKEHLWVP